MNSIFYEDLKLIQKDVEQLAAYNSMTNTVIIAGPGSGKTRVLTLKALTLAKMSINKPAGIACISFSRESVRELRKRLKQYGYMPTNKDFIGTVHSFSLQHIIKPFAHLFPQYGVKYPLRILPYEISNRLYQSVLSELKVDERMLKIGEINRQRSLSFQGLSSIRIESSDLIMRAASIYEYKLLATEYLDFISIINIAARMVHEQEFVRRALQSRFPWLLIDEYQDLGKALHEMVLELIFNADIKIYAVGDMNQSIYGFNGGYPDFLEELTTYEDIKPIHLAANYRSTQHIIEASLETLLPTPPIPKYIAQKRINEAADFTFVVCDEEMDQQYEIIAAKIIPKLISQGVQLNEIGIITGSNYHVRCMARVLKFKQIPFYIAKWDFENSNVVVWLQDCASWCVDKKNQSFDEIFRVWERLLINHMDSRKDMSRIQLKVIFHRVLSLSREKVTVYEWLKFITVELRIAETLKDSEMYPNEVKNLEDLINEAELHNLKDAQLGRFAKLGEPDNEITITTRHSAKGLEFEVVIMLGMEEEKFPNFSHLNNQMLLDEDQRLCYVCVSRAKKACILLRSKIYTIETRRGPWEKVYAPSRFWDVLVKKFGNKNNVFTHNTYK